MRQLLLMLCFASLVTGCSQIKPLPTTDLLLHSWQDNANWLKKQTHWTIKGKIGIRQDQQSTSANLSWDQRAQDYHIFMSGPLGQGAIDIQGNDSGIVLNISGDQRYVAESAEQLLEERMGWSLPISQLDHWIKGLPSPRTPYKKTLNQYNTLSTLEQSDWKIQYRSYHAPKDAEHPADRRPLPHKIILNRGALLRVTLIVKEWEIGSG